MLRVPLAAALLVLSLAGCSSGGSDESPAAPSPTPVQPTVPSEPAEPVLTDILFLLEAPHMAGLLPPGQDEIRTPVPSTADTSELLLWSLPRPGFAVIDGSAKIWVDVQGSYAHPGSANGGCFWNIVLQVVGPNGEISTVGPDECPAEPAVVEEGVRALEVTFSRADFGNAAGDTLSLWVSSNTFTTAPGASITALGGTSEYDSHLAIDGLQLPIDTTTLLW